MRKSEFPNVPREKSEHMDVERSDVVLNRYEVAKIVGLRALQLDKGANAFVTRNDNDTPLTIAVRELRERKLDVVVCRNGVYHHASKARLPTDFHVLYDTLHEF